jgi:hypothetical protein
MTTIVASVQEGVMVCDSRWQIDGDCHWPGTKVYRIGDALIGGAGDGAAIKKFLDWWRAGKKPPKTKFDGGVFEALVLDPSGLSWWGSTLTATPIERGWHGIGTGGKAAMGAMMHGATCAEAVTIAAQIDTCTGGEIRIHKLVE